jgi:hypothetical protein
VRFALKVVMPNEGDFKQLCKIIPEKRIAFKTTPLYAVSSDHRISRLMWQEIQLHDI